MKTGPAILLVRDMVVESWNHISYRKVYFNEYVQNSLGCDMGMIDFDLNGGW